MATKMTNYVLLGYHELFPVIPATSKESYGKRLGKEFLYKYAAYFLSYFRSDEVPDNEELIAKWFTYNEIKAWQVPFYHLVMREYNIITDKGKQDYYRILSVESFLKLFMWLREAPNIPEQVDNLSVYETLPSFQLYLLFNSEVLADYEVARKSIEGLDDDRHVQRMILSGAFPQHDLINVDNAQLMYTQFYKAIRFLDFITSDADFMMLSEKFLEKYECDSKADYLTRIGKAVILGMTSQKIGWTELNVPHGPDFEKDCAFLERIALHAEDEGTISDQDDYLELRTNPLQKIQNGKYRVIFDLFLVKKLYNGLVFAVGDVVKETPSLLSLDYLGTIRDRFSEGILLYDVMKHVFAKQQVVAKTGNEFKAIGMKREPDYYLRRGTSVILMESKDFFIKGDIKLSFKFPLIEAALKEGRLGKAVKQLAKNIERAFHNLLKLDEDFEPAAIDVSPVIIVHDSLYSAPALNYWVHYWMEDEMSKLKAKPENKVINFDKVLPVTIIEIDTLILFQDNLQRGELDLFVLIRAYQEHVNFKREGVMAYKQAYNHALESAISFAEFARDYGHQRNIEFDRSQLTALLRLYKVIPEEDALFSTARDSPQTPG